MDHREAERQAGATGSPTPPGRWWPFRARRGGGLLAAPPVALERVRWFYTLFGLAMLCVTIPFMIATSDRPPGWMLAGVAGLLLLLALWGYQYWRATTAPLWSDVLQVLTFTVVSLAVRDPSRAVPLVIVAIGLHAFYYSPRRLTVYGVLLYAGLLVAVLLEIRAGRAVPLVPALWPVPAAALAGVLTWMIRTILEEQEQAVRRERALSEAGARLVAARDRDTVHEAALDCLLDLAGRRPDVRAGIWLVDDDGMEAVAVAGGRARGLRGQRIAREHIPDSLYEMLNAPDVQYLTEDEIRVLNAGMQTDPSVVPLVASVPAKFGLPGLVTLGGDTAPLPPSETGAVKALATQVTLAWESLARTDDLEEREARFRAIIQHSSDAITVIGPDTTVTYASPSVRGVFGLDSETLIGTRLEDLVHPEDRSRLVAFLRRVAKPGRTVPFACRMRHADGTWLEIDSLGTNLTNVPAVDGIVLNSRDVTERKALERQLSIRAYYDSLTRLANRALLRLQIRRALARSERSGRRLALLLLDLDSFKMLNDSLGHLVGDEVLVAVAERLRACVRPHDTPARLGGDEFAVLLEDLDSHDSAVRVAERVIVQLGLPIQTSAGREVFARGSIGVALSGAEARTPDDLIRNADVAMYMAKADGVGSYRLFEPSMHDAVTERLGLESDLHRAIERDELLLHYQPIVRLDDGAILGVEALVRWEHPQLGLLEPQRFIPVAEDTGVIVGVGAWVLRAACQQAWRWQQAFQLPEPLSVAVNVSARQLQQADLAGQVRSILRDTGMAPGQLVLEITESLLVQHTEASIAKVEELKELGVRLAIDDFGTGFSSLSYLRRFPFDVLKIDQSFVQGVDTTESDAAALAQAIIQIGRALGLQTLAEGIETGDQLDRLVTLGCELGQGYHLSPPLEPSRLERLLATATRQGGTLDAGDGTP